MSSSEEEESQFSSRKGKSNLSKGGKKSTPEKPPSSEEEEVSPVKKKLTSTKKKVSDESETSEPETSEEEPEIETSESEEEKPKKTRGKRAKAKVEKKRKPKLDLENLTKTQKLELANKRKVKHILLSMIKERGASLGDEAKMISIPLYKYIMKIEDVDLEGDYPIGDKFIYVRFLTDSGKNSIVTDDVRVIMDEFRKRNKKKEEKWQLVHTLILLGEYSIHAAAKTMLTDKIVKSDIFIQFFNVRELCYNVLTHFYQPTYTKLTSEEERNLIDQGYSFNKAPYIRYADIVDEKNDKKESFCDPIVKFSGWGPESNVKEEGQNFALNCMFPDYLIYKAIRRR